MENTNSKIQFTITIDPIVLKEAKKLLYSEGKKISPVIEIYFRSLIKNNQVEILR